MAAKMTKKTRNLIIGAAFLLVLVALLLVLLFGPGSQQAEDSSSEESSTVSTTTVDLIASEMDDICELQVENASAATASSAHRLQPTRKTLSTALKNWKALTKARTNCPASSPLLPTSARPADRGQRP